MSGDLPPVAHEWLSEYTSQADIKDKPNYYTLTSKALDTSLSPKSFAIGTGEQILSSILSRCRATTKELLIVTCFWAESKSQKLVSSLLLYLSKKAQTSKVKIRVRICFSSSSVTQKLFHSRSPDGQTYPPSTWESKFGLPRPEQIPGLNLEIKSIFFLPFSVMHPKFIIMDRRIAWLPSCNVSWEKWFEGCVSFEGDLVESFIVFYRQFWGYLPPLSLFQPAKDMLTLEQFRNITNKHQTTDTSPEPITISLPARALPALILPSSHHQNPNFRPLFLAAPNPPPTPLNTLLLHLIATAKHSIYMQTPNLTCPAVSTALLRALSTGTNVHIRTSSRMMTIEQLLTAGTTTELHLSTLRSKYQTLLTTPLSPSTRHSTPDEENLHPPSTKTGELRIEWFKQRENDVAGPVKSHFKCSIFDDETIVLGSGNMDRASWFTSQELGIAIFDSEVVRLVREALESALVGRLQT